MKTLAIVSQKGGVGKTTVAVHVAVAAARAGYSVAIIDLDPQATAAQWGDWRNGEAGGDVNPVVVAAPHARLGPTLKEAEKMGVDLVVLDTPPAADAAAVAAARAADLVIIPTRASAFDLHAIRTTAELVRVAQKPAAVLLSHERYEELMERLEDAEDLVAVLEHRLEPAETISLERLKADLDGVAASA